MRRLVLAGVLALLLAACGSEDQRDPGGGGTGPAPTEQSDRYDY